MPGTRSGEYAHLAARPAGSGREVSAATGARFHSACAPLTAGPATPAPVPDPRAPPLLLGAAGSFSQRTFSFDLGRERFAVTERSGSRSSPRSALAYRGPGGRGEAVRPGGGGSPARWPARPPRGAGPAEGHRGRPPTGRPGSPPE
ncbi:unnamed protein product [Nyctereutes procyonoides]|uniref:(raccoon dog) hypothetical protein n=1 Tax=Nyctereutes procyonoides TaxID=34880 RepID=A0A811YDM6_NYCPR|nr:unnamed protein product [Nyctereutes procyonoides]